MNRVTAAAKCSTAQGSMLRVSTAKTGSCTEVRAGVQAAAAAGAEGGDAAGGNGRATAGTPRLTSTAQATGTGRTRVTAILWKQGTAGPTAAMCRTGTRATSRGTLTPRRPRAFGGKARAQRRDRGRDRVTVRTGGKGATGIGVSGKTWAVVLRGVRMAAAPCRSMEAQGMSRTAPTSSTTIGRTLAGATGGGEGRLGEAAAGAAVGPTRSRTTAAAALGPLMG